MKSVRFLVYRYLTHAEFFNLYKPSRSEQRGGGQTYIDFRVRDVSPVNWQRFFAGVPGVRRTDVSNGPCWISSVHSVGVPETDPPQTIKVYQRRPANVIIAAQHLGTRHANRVRAWHPENGFPRPRDPRNHRQLPPGLAVYLARTSDKEVWAGWFRNIRSSRFNAITEATRAVLSDLLSPSRRPGDGGFIRFRRGVLVLDESNRESPFTGAAPPVRRQRPEQEIVDSLFGEDEDVENGDQLGRAQREAIVRVRERNRRAVNDLKDLYEHMCQITEDTYLFRKRDGTYYTEAHHLLPLGHGGADSPHNIIIVSPFVHRMLHYADVSGVELSRICERNDGSATLEITINGQPYTIRWQQQHAERVAAHQARSQGPAT